MHIMTYGISVDGFKGLIEIFEADEFAQQEILFTIPIEESVAKEIESKKAFFEFIGEANIEAYIITDNRPTIVQLKANQFKQIITTQIHGKTITFKLDEDLNFKQTLISRIKPMIENTNFFNLIRAAIIIFGLILKDMFLALALLGMPNTYKNVLPKDGIKNTYVGKESKVSFQNMRFIILTLLSNEEMEDLFIYNKTFFVNKNDH